jgi:hypothetical protein
MPGLRQGAGRPRRGQLLLVGGISSFASYLRRRRTSARHRHWPSTEQPESEPGTSLRPPTPSPLGHLSLASQQHTQRSGRAATNHHVRDRPDRLNDATKNPERFRTAHLRTRTPGQVHKRHGGQYHLNRRASEDGRSLACGEVVPLLLGSHDCHATPNGWTRRSGQAACHCCPKNTERGIPSHLHTIIPANHCRSSGSQASTPRRNSVR